MKRLVLVPLLAIAAIGLHAETYLDNARVRSVDPRYESVNVPRQECTSQWVNEPRRTGQRDYGGAVIGGVAGALLGNQVGKGHGREAATAVGAAVGAFAGDDMANRGRSGRYEEVAREVTNCRMVNDAQTRIVGYQVGYEYLGQQFSTVIPDNPGPSLRVRVTVEPVAQ